MKKDEIETGKKLFFKSKKYIIHMYHIFLRKYKQKEAKIDIDDFLKNEDSNYGSFDIRTSVECPILKKYFTEI